MSSKRQIRKAEESKANKRSGNIVTISGLVTITGLSLRTLRTYIKEGMPIHEKKGRIQHFDTAQVINWLIEKETAKYKATSLEWEERKLRADVLLAEHRLAKADRNNIPINLVIQEVSHFTAHIRSTLRNLGHVLGGRIASVTDPNECRQLINKTTEAALASLSAPGVVRTVLDEMDANDE